jgi:hypothetical protein
VAPLLPVDSFSGNRIKPENLTEAKKDKYFDFELTALPRAEVKPDAVRYVETNPEEVPANEPDNTANVSDRNQQAAQEIAATEIDPLKRPSINAPDSRGKDTAIVSGDHANFQAGSEQTAVPAELKPEEQIFQQARADQTPLSGIEKDAGTSEDGIASNRFQSTMPSNNADSRIEGAQDSDKTLGGTVNTLKTSPLKPRPRPQLSQARPAMLQTRISGVAHRGIQATDAFKTEYGDYLAELWEIVIKNLDEILEETHVKLKSGTNVVVTFTLNSAGEVKIIRVEHTAGLPLMYCVLSAVQKPQPYRKWPQHMITLLGNEQQLGIELYVP